MHGTEALSSPAPCRPLTPGCPISSLIFPLTWSRCGPVPRHRQTGSRITHVVIGACPALHAMGLDCAPSNTYPARPTKQFLALGSAVGLSPVDGFELEIIDTPDLAALRDAAFHLVSPRGVDLPVEELNRAATAMVPGGLGLHSIGEGYRSVATDTTINERWILLWGGLGALLVGVISVLILGSDVLASARETAPLAALAHRRGWLAGVAVWRVWVPATLAALVAGLLYLVLPSGFPLDGGLPTPSVTYAGTTFALVCGLSALVAVWSASMTARAAAQWRPGLNRGRL